MIEIWILAYVYIMRQVLHWGYCLVRRLPLQDANSWHYACFITSVFLLRSTAILLGLGYRGLFPSLFECACVSCFAALNWAPWTYWIPLSDFRCIYSGCSILLSFLGEEAISSGIEVEVVTETGSSFVAASNNEGVGLIEMDCSQFPVIITIIVI